MSYDRPNSSRPPERRPSSGRAYDYERDGRAPARGGSSGNRRSSSSRPSNGARPSASRPSSSRPPQRPASRNGSSRPPQKRRPAPPRRRRRSALLLPLVVLIAIIAVVIVILRVFVFAEKDNTTYTLELPDQTMVVGSTSTASVGGLPEDFSGIIQWSSSKTEIVGVKDGKLTAKQEGESVISASVNGKNVSGTVKVIATITGVKAVTLTEGPLSIFSGETHQLKYEITYEDGIDNPPAYKPNWTSSNASVVSVTNDGLVTARDVGKASITVTAGNQSAVCTVTVTKNPNAVASDTLDDTGADPATGDGANTPGGEGQDAGTTPPATNTNTNTNNNNTQTGGNASVTALSLSQEYAELSVGDPALPLMASTAPNGATITWTSSDSAIASVADGQVTAVAPGTVTITAKAGLHSATCTIQVSPAEDTPVQ